MSSPPQAAKCPACGQALSVVLAAGPATQWFPCPNCHRPVAVPAVRTPPPLYSWEVVGGLYPPLPPPRRPRWRSSTLAAVFLAAVAALALVLGGALAVYGWQASQSSTTYSVSGTVTTTGSGGGTVPVIGALVTIRGEGGFFNSTTTTPPLGAFRFVDVPAGGVNLSVNASSYENASLVTFVSSVFDAGSSGLAIELVSGPSGAATATVLSPYADMESFLASVGAGAVLFVLVGLLAAGAAVFARRPGGAIVGVLGGGGGIGTAGAMFFLALGTPFPLISVGAGVVGGLGAFVVALDAALLARGDPDSVA